MIMIMSIPEGLQCLKQQPPTPLAHSNLTACGVNARRDLEDLLYVEGASGFCQPAALKGLGRLHPHPFRVEGFRVLGLSRRACVCISYVCMYVLLSLCEYVCACVCKFAYAH